MRHWKKKSMRYLLIDFGASYIKCVEYDSETEQYSNQSFHPSPFNTSSTITKQELKIILRGLLIEHHRVDRILICTILGGFYDGDTYHSWKSNQSGIASSCMIGGLFMDEPTFHIHEHHAKVFGIENFELGLKIIGYLDDTPIYSPLGDTDCVINSVMLDDYDILINMGTGSQVIRKTTRKSFIPSGRALLTFANFFEELGLDMFEYMSNLSLREVQNSSLIIDLNVFKQAHQYTDGGQIVGIHEGNFNLKNFIGSILKSYMNQYDQFISDVGCNRIILTGGIPKKLPIIHEYFSLMYPEKKVILDNHSIENTHRGMANYIQEYL